MKTSRVTAKGQVTIPASVRYQLDLNQGDSVGFILVEGSVVLVPVASNITAAFGSISTRKNCLDSKTD